MAALDCIPSAFDAGTTVTWTTTLSEYTSPTWALRTIVSSATHRLEVTGVAASGGWESTIAAADSEALPAGEYEWRAYVESGAERHLVGSGSTTIRPSALSAPADLRSRAKRSLDAIDAVLEKRASRDQEEMQFNGRMLRRMSVRDLRELRSYFLHKVRRENAKRRGSGDSSLIRVRFR